MTYTPPDRLREHFGLDSTGCTTAEEDWTARFPLPIKVRFDNIVAYCRKNMFGLLKENLGKPLVQRLLVFWYIVVRRTDTPTSGLLVSIPHLTVDKSAASPYPKVADGEEVRPFKRPITTVCLKDRGLRLPVQSLLNF